MPETPQQMLLSRSLPYYENLKLTLPPLLDVLEWSDRQQFDAIHISTPGPMGLCGWIVSKMLRVPLLATYHTDFPAYVAHLTRDHRMANSTREHCLRLRIRDRADPATDGVGEAHLERSRTPCTRCPRDDPDLGARCAHRPLLMTTTGPPRGGYCGAVPAPTRRSPPG